MRHLIVSLPRGSGDRALEVARGRADTHLVLMDAAGLQGPREVLLINAPNDGVEPIIEGLQQLDDVHLTLLPTGVLFLSPPAREAAEAVLDVAHRSPLEVFLGGLQSVGSWTGFLGYAVAAGVVVWTGLHTNTIYLLVAAMLIAPFAGPAMTLALGSARGDLALITRSAGRYFTSLLVCVGVAFALSTLLRQGIATELMVETSLLSAVAVLLPLSAGAAGALNLCQSERNSLVTAAGPGILVAASLAPPAGVIGMASALGEWDLMRDSAFVLLLQLVGINLSGTIVFALFGLSPRGVRYARGRASVRRLAVGGTVVALLGLLTWQFWSPPHLERSTRAQRMKHTVEQVVSTSGLAHLVNAEVRFTRPDIPGQHTVLVVAHVQRRRAADPPADPGELSARIAAAIAASEGYAVVPLVDLRVLEPPEAAVP